MHSVLFIAKEHQSCYILLKTNKFNNHYSLPHYKAKNILNVSGVNGFMNLVAKHGRENQWMNGKRSG
jgi:hypothetical protein